MERIDEKCPLVHLPVPRPSDNCLARIVKDRWSTMWLVFFEISSLAEINYKLKMMIVSCCYKTTNIIVKFPHFARSSFKLALNFCLSCVGHNLKDYGWIWSLRRTRRKMKKNMQNVFKVWATLSFRLNSPHLFLSYRMQIG